MWILARDESNLQADTQKREGHQGDNVVNKWLQAEDD